MSEAGRFITFEGGEGSGKTTQIARLLARLAAMGRACSATREPGGSPAAESVRALALHPAPGGNPWQPLTQALMFQAARVQHLHDTVQPALAAGKIVLCDRFSDSTLVYQGLGQGMGQGFIARLHAMTLGNFTPHLTLMLDLPPETGLARVAARGGEPTLFDKEQIAFHRTVREGFLRLAAAAPERCVVIKADAAPEAVEAAIWREVAQRCAL